MIFLPVNQVSIIYGLELCDFGLHWFLEIYDFDNIFPAVNLSSVFGFMLCVVFVFVFGFLFIILHFSVT